MMHVIDRTLLDSREFKCKKINWKIVCKLIVLSKSRKVVHIPKVALLITNGIFTSHCQLSVSFIFLGNYCLLWKYVKSK